MVVDTVEKAQSNTDDGVLVAKDKVDKTQLAFAKVLDKS